MKNKLILQQPHQQFSAKHKMPVHYFLVKIFLLPVGEKNQSIENITNILSFQQGIHMKRYEVKQDSSLVVYTLTMTPNLKSMSKRTLQRTPNICHRK